MPSGRYDRRITIQRRTVTRDALGGAVSTWSDLARRWASIEDQSGRELYRAQQIDPTVSAVVTLREQYDGLSPRDRIVYGSRTFNVGAVMGKSDRTTKRGQIVAVTEEV